MEWEQIQKRVDWLDEERRKDKVEIVSLGENVARVIEDVPALRKEIKGLESEITQLSAKLARMDNFDETIMRFRTEARMALEEQSKEIKQREEEREKIHRLDIRTLEQKNLELRQELVQAQDFRRSMQARVEEERRLGKMIDEMRLKIDSIRHSEDEYTRSYRILEDGRRQDNKRLTDLLGETTALRKHMDDQRGRMELVDNSLRKLETRLNELNSLESERREAQAIFIEEQTLRMVERDRIWKEWQNRFDTIEQQTADVEVNLQTLDATHRAVKRSQEALDESTQKVDRRINEMVEIQRLAEERFRQEWITFKADDQKRWTNYTLTQEEERGEMLRQFEKLNERVTHLEDTLQELQDSVQEMGSMTGKQLQSLLAMVHDWVTNFERSTARGR